MSARWTHVTASSAAELAPLADLGEEALALLEEGQSSQAFAELLQTRALALDAIRFLAQVLPGRHAVWWACLAVRESGGDALSEPELEMLAGAEAWVAEPDDDQARACFALAEAQGFANASAWAAVGTLWCSSSLAPPDVPAVPPGRDLPGKAAGGAVMLAAVKGGDEKNPDRILENYVKLLELGTSVAEGRLEPPGGPSKGAA